MFSENRDQIRIKAGNKVKENVSARNSGGKMDTDKVQIRNHNRNRERDRVALGARLDQGWWV